MPAIPRIIHQTWKDAAVPAQLARLAQGWRRHHPQWTYRFWDDAALRALVADRHPELLALFDAYAQPICRVDLARYVIMEACGGLYADLDFECLAPNDPLLADHALLIGLEPSSHLDVVAVKARGLSRLLSPAWIASIPGHPFWAELLREAACRGSEPDPLVATGPILLSDVASRWRGTPALHLLDAALLHPVDKHQGAALFDLQRWQAATRSAYAVHHWAGSWWRGEAGTTRDDIGDAEALLIEPGKPHASLRCQLRRDPGGAAGPLVSALMITARRPALAACAIASFRAQTYAHRELLIIDDGNDDTLAEHVAALADPRVRLLRLPAAGRSLGALRNIAVAQARGEFVCQWDDDDLYDPARIECQMQALQQTSAQACFLRRWLIWWPARRRLAVSNARIWEGSMLARKLALPMYPELRRGEDTPVVDALVAGHRVVLLDQPRLYVYVVHGANTFDAPHFEQQWQAASAHFEGDAYRRLSQQLQKRVDLDAQHSALATRPAMPAPGTADTPDISVVVPSGEGYGLAIAARMTLIALHAAGVDCEAVALPSPRHLSRTAPGVAARATRAIRILHTNPEFIVEALADARSAGAMREVLAARYLIGIWAWESPNTFRAEQRQAFDHFDEIWVPSRYVRDALAQVAPIPVLCLPIAVQRFEARPERAAWGLPEDACVFLVVFDAYSHFERKNPLATIAAFRLAFDRRAHPRARLVLKAAHLQSAQRALLEAAIDGDRRILLFDGQLDPARYQGLVASADAMVSLHRAEGFGLVMAEAMACGKPVIASRCSGNLEFMNEGNSLLVDVDPLVLEADDDCYPAGTQWSAPRIALAAAHMRHVHDHPDAAAALGAVAAAQMADTLSPSRIGALMRARLREIAGAMPQQRLQPGTANVATARVARRSPPASSLPRVLVATPMRNAQQHLDRHADLLEGLDYPADKLALAVVESGSEDRTAAQLDARRARYGERFGRVVLDHPDAAASSSGLRWTPQQQYRRRAAIARARNRALEVALGDAEWVLWIDVDVIDYAPDLLHRLLDTGADIVTPHCVLDRGGPSFDLNSFVRDPAGLRDDWTRYACDGLAQPPRGLGRRYLDSFRGQERVAVDSVGATMLLVRADVHRSGLVFPDFSDRGYIETEAFAMRAIERGHAALGLPDLEVFHYRG